MRSGRCSGCSALVSGSPRTASGPGCPFAVGVTAGPPCQHWYRRNLLPAQALQVESIRPLGLDAPDNPLRGDDHINPEVMILLWYLLVQHLLKKPFIVLQEAYRLYQSHTRGRLTAALARCGYRKRRSSQSVPPTTS